MNLKKIAWATCLSGLSVAQVQASISAYDKISGGSTLSVVSPTSLQSTVYEVAEEVVVLGNEVTELSDSVSGLEESISDLDTTSSSSSSSGNEVGSWAFTDLSFLVDSSYYIDIYPSSMDDNFFTYDSTAASPSDTDEEVFASNVGFYIEDFTCLVGMKGYIETYVQSFDYVYTGYYYLTCE